HMLDERWVRHADLPAAVGSALIAGTVGLLCEPLGMRLAKFVPAAMQAAAGMSAANADRAAKAVPCAPIVLGLGQPERRDPRTIIVRREAEQSEARLVAWRTDAHEADIALPDRRRETHVELGNRDRRSLG